MNNNEFLFNKKQLEEEENQARTELVKVAKLIYKNGYNASIDGNLSYRLSDNSILMTPKGIHKGFMSPESLIVTDIDGKLLRGDSQPTSEYRLHAKIFKKRTDIRCIIHTHSPYALAASLAGIDLHQTYITVAPVPTTQYARIASEQSADVLEPYIEKYNWAIIPRHGVVVWSDTIWNAFLRIEGLEHYAKILVLANSIKPIQPLPNSDRDELLKFWGINI
ncbi:MAG: hypothetical protein ACD_21C00331G0005 [uncultured bacterium]|nr:MAG: hypothetical protein ACD_21C00331G0005 [uncultured bacterium]